MIPVDKVAEHSFQVPMPNSPLLLNYFSLRAGSHLGAHARAAKSEFKSEVIL